MHSDKELLRTAHEVILVATIALRVIASGGNNDLEEIKQFAQNTITSINDICIKAGHGA